MKDKIQDKLNKFVDKNRQRIIAGALLTTMGISSLFGFVGGTAIEQKKHDETKEQLDKKIVQVHTLNEQLDETQQKIQAMIDETEALIKKYDEAMKALVGSSTEFKALVNEKISKLATLVETKEFSQAHRIHVNNAIVELCGLINNSSSMSEEEKQSLLDLVDTMESKYVMANIENARNNVFENDAVKMTQQTTESRDGKPNSYSQMVFFGGDVTVGASQSKLNTVWKVYAGNKFEKCEVDLSETGKHSNPTAYYEGDMYGIGIKSEAKENFMNQLSETEFSNWDYDANQDSYAGAFEYDGMAGKYTFDIDGKDLAMYSIKAQGNAYDSDYSIDGVMRIEGVPQSIYEQHLETITKLIAEAKDKALENPTEKGE